MKEIRIYLATSARSPKVSYAAAGYVLEYQTAKGPATLRGFETYEDTTKNKVELQILIAALSRLREKGLQLIVYTNSEYVAAAIRQGWVQQWKGRNWKNTRGAPIKNAAEWEKLDNLLLGQAIRIKTGADHPYREWLEWEISKKCHEGK